MAPVHVSFEYRRQLHTKTMAPAHVNFEYRRQLHTKTMAPAHVSFEASCAAVFLRKDRQKLLDSLNDSSPRQI